MMILLPPPPPLYKGCIFLCGNKHTTGEHWFYSLTSLNLTKWNKAGLMMGQNVNVETSLQGGAGLIYEFAYVLQPNMAEIRRCSCSTEEHQCSGCEWPSPSNLICLGKCENISTVMNGAGERSQTRRLLIILTLMCEHKFGPQWGTSSNSQLSVWQVK